MRRANLLDQMGRSEESAQLINLYSRLFPDNAEILIAQATCWMPTALDQGNELIDRALALKTLQHRCLRHGHTAGRDAGRAPQALEPDAQAFRDAPNCTRNWANAIQHGTICWACPAPMSLVSPDRRDLQHQRPTMQVAALFGTLQAPARNHSRNLCNGAVVGFVERGRRPRVCRITAAISAFRWMSPIANCSLN
jgi:hypothetical protein